MGRTMAEALVAAGVVTADQAEGVQRKKRRNLSHAEREARWLWYSGPDLDEDEGDEGEDEQVAGHRG